jgi:superoxide dismutase, Cu-Zn family
MKSTSSIKIVGSLGIAALLALQIGCERRERQGLPEPPPPSENPVTPRISPATPAVTDESARGTTDEGARGTDQREGDPTAAPGKEDPVVSDPYAKAAELQEGDRTNVSGTDAEKNGPTTKDHREAEADFKTAEGYKLSGDAEFDEVVHGVKIVVEVENAPPGKRGIHIHEKGDCSDIPGKSMGEHFSPHAANHGLPSKAKHHLGDLGNIQIDKEGKGRMEITVPNTNLKENDPMSLLGRSLVIHESEDKGTQASSGKPMSCAVIEKS